MVPAELEKLNAEIVSDQTEVRLTALKRLDELARAGDVDASSLPSLIILFDSPSVDDRRRATWIVAKLAQNKIEAFWPIEALNRLTMDKDAEVRENAAWALGELAGMRIGVQGSLSFLTQLLLDRESMVRGMAAWSLGRFAERLNMGSPLTLELLQKLTQDKSPYVRKSAEYAYDRMR
jgi:HEAT repeat protein